MGGTSNQPGSTPGGGLLGKTDKAATSSTALALGGGIKPNASGAWNFSLGGSSTGAPVTALAAPNAQQGNNALAGPSKTGHKRPPRVTMQQLSTYFHRRPGAGTAFPHFFDYLSPQLQNVQTNQQFEQIKMS